MRLDHLLSKELLFVSASFMPVCGVGRFARGWNIGYVACAGWCCVCTALGWVWIAWCWLVRVACGALLGLRVSAVGLVSVLVVPFFWPGFVGLGVVGWCFENCTVDASI